MIELLLERAQAAGIPLSREEARKLGAFHRLLVEANARFNLTRVSAEPIEAIDRNYLDSLTPLREGLAGVRSAIDVGSGAGFPGIPLSVCMPDTHFVLMDAQEKRVEFLRRVISELGLNAEALQERAEDAARRPELREQFDLAVARAVAPLNLLAEYLLPFVHIGGQMLAYKGPGADEELAHAANALRLLGGGFERATPAPIPGRDWDHRLIWFVKLSPTPDKFPRRAGRPEKAPL